MSAAVGQYEDYFSWVYSVFGQNLDSKHETYDEFGNLIESWTARSAFGVFMKEPGVSGFVTLDNPYDDVHYSMAMYLEMQGTDISDWYGTLLVKDTNIQVPEPSGVMLALFGLLALLGRRQLRR